MHPQTFIFIGRSGAGKGTQIELLIKKLKEKTKFDVFHLEPGQGFRNFVKSDSHTAKLSRMVGDKGELQPSFLSIWVWTDLLVKNMTGNEHIIFDGMPRRVSEGKVLESALKFYGHEQPHMVYVDVSRKWAVLRLQGRKRSDDGDQSIIRRMDWFDSDVAPAVEYMKHNTYYKFSHINGEQTVEDVHKEICNKLELF